MTTKDINGFPHVLYQHETLSPEVSVTKSKEFYDWIDSRRSVRDISDQPVPREVVENIVRSAASAPSGAHKQPWTFCVVSDQEIKSAIRKAAEKEEFDSYNGRMSERWIKDLKPLATDWNKPFLEKSPYLIILFKKVYERDEEGAKHNNYYVNESVGIAAGFLITAIHNAGLVTLTHTPSPMNFLGKILDRPENERAFLLLPVGYPDDSTYVPKLERKELDDIAKFY